MRFTAMLLRTTLALTAACGTAAAAEGPDLLPLADGATVSLASIPASKLAALDMAKVAAEDAEDDRKDVSGGLRYAVPAKLSVEASRDGRWQKALDGRAVWHWRVRSPDALHLNFGFDRFFLPEGATLRILAAEGKTVLGPFTSAHNSRHRQLWTAPLFANEAIIEVAVPEGLKSGLELNLAQVGIGYRGFGLKSKHCKSGACNTDVACLGANDPFNLPRRAVGTYSFGGARLCTGSLVNNTRGDRRMLFVTATHCDVTAANAASVVVLWNFEAPTCRLPGSAESDSEDVIGPITQFQNGAALLAATNNPFEGGGTPESRSDFTLLELVQPANPAFNLYWAGWDRRDEEPLCGPGALCASIHQPDGDEKRITFSESPFERRGIQFAGGAHWFVRWSSQLPLQRLPNLPTPVPASLPPSVTERGSSGAPMYNAQQRLVGVLSGGPSTCGATGEELADFYGQLSRAWDGVGTATTRMRDALDPVGGGSAQVLDGIGSCTAPVVDVTAPAAIAAGAAAAFSVSATGAGPFRVEYDFDDDGLFDTAVTDVVASTQRQATFPKRGGVSVGVRVTDRNNCSAFIRRAVVVQAPDVTISAQAPQQVCGNGDADIDPGERWRIPVTLANGGEVAMQQGAAIFARATSSSGTGAVDSFGNRLVDSTTAACPFNYVDISGEPVLAVSDSDDGRAEPNPIALGPAGMPFYGNVVRSVAMSTNGYLSVDTAANGNDFSNTCGVVAADGPRLNVLHDDFVVRAGGGLRRRYFATCPRASDAGQSIGCTVLQWTNMGRFVDGGEPAGSADFQAVLYDNGQIVYQYRTPDPLNGGSATIGIHDGVSAGLEYGCNAANRIAASRAVCFFPPSAQPTLLQTPRLAFSASRDLGNLAAGSSVARDVDFAVDPAAACGAPLAVRYVGSVDRVAHSLRPATLLDRRVGGTDGVCNAQPQCFPDANASPLPARRDGSFTNFTRLGNGVAAFTVPNGNQWSFAGAWFTNTRDRSPIWYIVQGDFGDRRLNSQAPVQIFRFRRTSTTPFRVESAVVGTGEVTYITPTDFVFTWTLDGVSAGERLVQAYTGGYARPERTGLWFNPAEDGWGVLLEDVAPITGRPIDQLVLNYLYDGAGRPTWALGAVPGVAGGSAPLRVFFAHCPDCPALVDPPTAPAGTSTTAFGSLTTGTYSTNITLPAPLSGTWVRSNLPLQMLTPPQQP